MPVKLKAPNYNAKRGQTIAGRLVRGEGGRFSSSGAASARVPPKQLPKAPKARSGGGKGRVAPKLTKPKLTPEQRQQQREQARGQATQAKRAERDRILAEAGLGGADGLAGALIDARDGNTLTPANGQKLAEQGLAEQGRDGQYRLTPAGRQVVNAAERGDAGAVRDTMGRASDRAAAQRERQGKKISAAMQRATQATPKPAKVGGGGSKKKPPVVRRVPARSSSRPQAARSSGGGRGSGASTAPELPRPLVDAARALSEGRPADEGLLVRNGLAKRGKDGRLALTAQGLRAIREKATTKALRVVEHGGDTIQGNSTIHEAYGHAQTYGEISQQWLGMLLDRDWAYATDNGYALREPGEIVAIEPSFQAQLDDIRARNRPDFKSFAVFKDARGAYRWIARTTTAYRDRDGEIISIKALEDDAARMTATGQYGPLRYWHVGQPDPLSVEAPWGPGLDIGDCDFSIVIGRTSIESGTFKSAELGQAFAATADEHELSPGFFHAIGEPDASGVFHHTKRFERSAVPTRHGRASNLFTGLTVKEHRMDQQTYEQRVKTYLDFAREHGIPPEVAAAPLTAMQQSDKEATARQIAYKEQAEVSPAAEPSFAERLKAWLAGDPPEPVATKAEEPAPDPIAALTARIEALTAEIATLKAGPPAEVVVETQADEPMVEVETDAEMPMEDVGGEMSADEFLAAIGAVLDAKLGPLVEALGITTKLDGHMGELKSLLSGFAAQKDDERAQLTARLDQAEAKVAELAGDAPRVGYRASQAQDTTVDAILETLKESPGAANQHPFADLASQLFPTIGARQ